MWLRQQTILRILERKADLRQQGETGFGTNSSQITKKVREEFDGNAEDKRTRGSKRKLQNETIKFISKEMAFNYMHYKHPDNRAVQIQRHEQMQTPENVTKPDWPDELKIEDSFYQYWYYF